MHEGMMMPGHTHTEVVFSSHLWVHNTFTGEMYRGHLMNCEVRTCILMLDIQSPAVPGQHERHVGGCYCHRPRW